MIDKLTAMFQGNQFLSGGMVVMAAGAAVAYCRRLPKLISSTAISCLTVSVDIQDDDESYQWMNMYLAERLKTTRRLSVQTRKKNAEAYPGSDPEEAFHDYYVDPDSGAEVAPVKAARPKVTMVPAPGKYRFWFKGRPVFVSRERNDVSAGGGGGGGAGGVSLGRKESFTLRILSRDQSLAREMVEEARDLFLPADGKIEIRTPRHGYWNLLRRMSPRPFDSVILADGVADRVLKEIVDFRAARKWYTDLGIPFRKGLMFEGVPGSGKSSFVSALASRLQMPVYVLNLSQADLTDDRLSELVGLVPDGGLLLLEDIDCAFSDRERSANDRLTFSGLLNALDGVAAHDGRVVIMTTNHPERLDPALIRPGRVDVRIHFGNATKGHARKLFVRFYDCPPAVADEFEKAVSDGEFSMASLQGHLLEHKGDPVEAIRRLPDLKARIDLEAEERRRAAEGKAAEKSEKRAAKLNRTKVDS